MESFLEDYMNFKKNIGNMLNSINGSAVAVSVFLGRRRVQGKKMRQDDKFYDIQIYRIQVEIHN